MGRIGRDKNPLTKTLPHLLELILSAIIVEFQGIRHLNVARKKRDQAKNGQGQTNNALTADTPAYLFSAMSDNSGFSSSWYLDSGASQHMSPQKELFRDYQLLETPRIILLGDNRSHNALGYGSVLLKVPNWAKSFNSRRIICPWPYQKLISVSQITTTGNTVIIFTQTQCLIKTKSPDSSKKMIYRIPKEGSLFSFGVGIPPTESNYVTTTLSKSDSETLKWHYRLGHLNIKSINLMQTHNMVNGLPPLKSNLPLCEGCVFGKQTQSSYPTTLSTRAIAPLALIHTDLCGPMSTPSLGGALYFLLFIDDYSRFTHVYFLNKKSSTLSLFPNL